MNRLSDHHPKRSPKRSAKAKKKPVKVVYISNPMRVTTSAAKFRGLVQKLTGRDSNVAEMDASGASLVFDDADDVEQYSPDSAAPASSAGLVACEYYGGGTAVSRRTGVSVDSGGGAVGLYASSEMFDVDDAFAPQLLESFAQSSMYEPQSR
ncbi:hypothetical protein Cni_G11899 [Canna indica]|uniref:VQ domain-containing protein n=1 Tax=Canna indica TaxID=4628 RepID=A0AAQ3Q9Y4_9LILI|nr:hypothetical protein Cni_G11899 [Canna indica]